MNQDGFARFASVENLALRARVTLEEAKAAEQAFLSPDPHSSNPENEGRRIQKVPGGYVILNAHLYRALATQEQQRQQNRDRVNRYRIKNQGKRKRSITPHYTPLPPVCVSASVSASDFKGGEFEGNRIPTIEAVLKWLATAKSLAPECDYTEQEVRTAFRTLSVNGWMWGKNPIIDWRAAVETQITRDRDGRKGGGAHSILDMKTVRDVKLQQAEAIKNKYAVPDPTGGLTWQDQNQKKRFYELHKEAKQLNANIANAI